MKIESVVNEVSVEFHDELNPALWDNMEIKLDVQVQLLKIAKKFIEFLNVPNLNIIDVYFMGSNAAYVYTSFSDIDLHVIVDDPNDNLKELYDAKKRLWNDQHEISIRGYNVELYVQDIKDSNASMGIYSLLKNKWIKQPEKVEANIDDASVQQKFKYLAKKIIRGINKRDLNYLDSIASEIKDLRKSGLQHAGEFSVENLAFKELRNGGYLEKLSNARQELGDKQLSLDEFNNHSVEEGRYESDSKHVYDILKYALADAKKTGKKVVWSKGGYYKLADLSDPRPALDHNYDRPNQVAKLKQEIERLDQISLLGFKNPAEYKKLYYKKYGPHYKGPSILRAKLNKEISDIPYAVEKEENDKKNLPETLKKVKGRWALVSRKDPSKVLQYYKGSGHPSKDWVSNAERRVHSFSEGVGKYSELDASELTDLVDDLENLQDDINSQSIMGDEKNNQATYKKLEKDYRALEAIKNVVNNNLLAIKNTSKNNYFIYAGDWSDIESGIAAIHFSIENDLAHVNWLGSYGESGRALLIHALENAKSKGAKKVKVEAKWESEGFYSKMGFSQDAEHKESDPFTKALTGGTKLMSKELNELDDDRARRLLARNRIRKRVGTRHVYDYEHNVLSEIKRLAQPRDLNILTNLANKIWAQHYNGKRKIPTIRFGPGDMSHGYPLSYTLGYSLIELAPGQRDILTLIHELVHAIGPALHGASFTKKYYEMLKDYLPAKVQDAVYNELVLRHGDLLKPYYKKMMAEAPVADLQTVGDFEKPGSFTTTKYDPAIVKNPKAQQKVYNFFQKSPYKFRLYPLNIPGARKFSETGKVDIDWLEKNLPSAAEIVKKNPPNDEIIVFYISNTGAEKVPFTPWIMAHRMGHAFRPNNYAWGEFVSYWMEQMKQILSGYYGADVVRMEDPRYIALQNALGTMKSARESKISRPYEFLYELLAQYINTGSVKLNPLPRQLGYGKQNWGKHSRAMNMPQTDDAEIKNHVEMLERDLDYYLDSILGSAQNKIFVM